MALDFTRLSDVTLVEEATETANVLIEESGEIKKVPKTEVGGGGKADMVIKLSSPFITNNDTAENTTVTIESGSLQAVVDVLRNGEVPVVKVHHFYTVEESIPLIEGGVYNCSVVHYGEYITFSFAIPIELMMKISMSIDDPDYLEVWGYPLTMTAIQII